MNRSVEFDTLKLGLSKKLKENQWNIQVLWICWTGTGNIKSLTFPEWWYEVKEKLDEEILLKRRIVRNAEEYDFKNYRKASRGFRSIIILIYQHSISLLQ